MGQQFYISTAADAVRFDTPTYQIYVGVVNPANTSPFFPGGYAGPFVSLTGIVQVYMSQNGGGYVQHRDIQATDNPAIFPNNAPLAVLYLDAVGRIQRITDYT